KRDVQKLTTPLPEVPVAPPVLNGLATAEEQERASLEFNQRQRLFWQSDAGRALALAERSFVLLFETNGNFHIDNVPPGKYNLLLKMTDPEEEYYRRRQIASLTREVVVPDEPGSKI